MKDLEIKCSFKKFEQKMRKKYISKFGHVRKFEMKHVNNRVLQIYLQHKSV
jgi:hypothetical protein